MNTFCNLECERTVRSQTMESIQCLDKRDPFHKWVNRKISTDNEEIEWVNWKISTDNEQLKKFAAVTMSTERSVHIAGECCVTLTMSSLVVQDLKNEWQCQAMSAIYGNVSNIWQCQQYMAMSAIYGNCRHNCFS